jgi:hypothetical protein
VKPYRVEVFGKKDCEKCGVLNQRLDKLLVSEDWQDFEKQYRDMGTKDGIVAFCLTECLDPQRLPAMVVTRWNDEKKTYEPVPNRTPGVRDALCGQSRLYQYVGLQTDYAGSGKGIISPKMIAAILSEAKELTTAAA